MRHVRLLFLPLLAALLPAPAHAASSSAPPANCSAAFRIDVTLDSGTRWTMCWEERQRQGLVFHDITFTPPGGTPVPVMAQANPAQVHVPYDDNGARYHDETDYGLGGTDMAVLQQSTDCPDGVLLYNNNRAIVCQHIVARGYAIKWYADAQQGTALHVFSVSHVGEYNYIFDYGFDDDGTIELAVGASGRLQRYTHNPVAGTKYGFPLHGAQYGISHVHNFYWRLDFDLGGTTQNTFEELQFPPEDSSSETRILQSQDFSSEAARQVSPNQFRTWRVLSTVTNADGAPISYQIDSDPANVFHGPVYEPFTNNEVYATVYRSCEQFASHNPTIAGCAPDVAAFVNGESLTGADLVVWYGQAFHHLPHDEDQPRMDTHWSRFYLRPLGVTATNPLAKAAAP